MSLPTGGKIPFLHNGQFLHDLGGIGALDPEPAAFSPLRRQHIEHYCETLAKARDRAVCCLAVSSKINEQHAGLFPLINEPAHPVRKILPVNLPGPGPHPFRKDQKTLPPIEHLNAFIEESLHTFPAPPAIDRDAFHQIADNHKKKILVKILPLREIPRNIPEVEDMVKKRKKSVADHDRVDHRQMIGTDKPRPFIPLVYSLHLASDLFKIADAVTHQTHKEKTERHRQKSGTSTDNALQKKACSIAFVYHDPETNTLAASAGKAALEKRAASFAAPGKEI
jgi:hypothetical protein